MIGDIIGYALCYALGQACDFCEAHPGSTSRPPIPRDMVRDFMREILDWYPDDDEQQELALDAMMAGYYREDPEVVYDERACASADR